MTKHPLYVKPSTVERFRPRYLSYALTADEVANAIRDGRIKPAALLTKADWADSKAAKWREGYKVVRRHKWAANKKDQPK